MDLYSLSVINLKRRIKKVATNPKRNLKWNSNEFLLAVFSLSFSFYDVLQSKHIAASKHWKGQKEGKTIKQIMNNMAKFLKLYMDTIKNFSACYQLSYTFTFSSSLSL